MARHNEYSGNKARIAKERAKRKLGNEGHPSFAMRTDLKPGHRVSGGGHVQHRGQVIPRSHY
jgi:hypothetical protein